MLYEVITPDWRGDLLVGALAARDLRRLEMEGDRLLGEEVLFEELDSRIRDVRVGPDGAVYLLVPDRVLRVVPADPD